MERESENNLVKTADLIELASQLASEALSPNTRKAYSADWKRWIRFCEERDFDPLGPPGQLAVWIAEVVQTGGKVPTIDRMLAAVSLAYKTKGLPSPRQDPAVQLVWRGARRRIGVAPEQVEALLPSHLRLLSEALPMDNVNRLRSLRNRAAMVIGWAGGFRRTELIALNVEDVQEVPEGLRIRIRRSKTDQEGKGRVIGLPYGAVLATCPVRCLRAWLDASGIQEGALFRAVSPDGRTVLPRRWSDRQFADSIQSAAQLAGLPGRYAGHSLRSGLVTAAVQANKPLSSIMAQTGHKTVEVLLRYVREQGLFEDNAAAGLM